MIERQLGKGRQRQDRWPAASSQSRRAVQRPGPLPGDQQAQVHNPPVGRSRTAAHLVAQVDQTALEAITVSGDQQFRLDLSEAVQDALDAEIRRTGRPHRTQPGAGEHPDHGLRDIGHDGRDAVARTDTQIVQGRGQARTLRVTARA